MVLRYYRMSKLLRDWQVVLLMTVLDVEKCYASVSTKGGVDEEETGAEIRDASWVKGIRIGLWLVEVVWDRGDSGSWAITISRNGGLRMRGVGNGLVMNGCNKGEADLRVSKDDEVWVTVEDGCWFEEIGDDVKLVKRV
ncbi:unnamed protein product [Vicia faba]|uniref:Uncharacterized protein n=1 Tax=Vicia faba TaxID=3906 RepID=A0AAV0YQQ8_VICFA|nr:unnamed protein product [Vicia faba]